MATQQVLEIKAQELAIEIIAIANISVQRFDKQYLAPHITPIVEQPEPKYSFGGVIRGNESYKRFLTDYNAIWQLGFGSLKLVVHINKNPEAWFTLDFVEKTDRGRGTMYYDSHSRRFSFKAEVLEDNLYHALEHAYFTSMG